MDKKLQLPFYVQLTIKLLMVVTLAAIIMFAKTLFVNLAFSILLSILLLPFSNFLKRRLRFPKGLANITSVILALAVIVCLFWFLSKEVGSFLADMPTLQKNLDAHYQDLQFWVQQRFGVTYKEQSNFLDSASSEATDTAKVLLAQTFSIVTHLIFDIIMVAIYTFLLLYYRHNIRRFLYAVFNKEVHEDVGAVLEQSKEIVQKYMTGLLIEMAIIAVANSTILLIIGVKYAIFLGIFSAILNVIPYVGIITGILFSCLVTLTTDASMSQVLWIIIGFEIVHFIDSNFLMPRIVGSKVKINALITIVGVVAGGTLIGLPGIFLALPTIAILKIIFDRIEDMKPWAELMGDDLNEPGGIYKRLRKLRRKNVPVEIIDHTAPGEASSDFQDRS